MRVSLPDEFLLRLHAMLGDEDLEKFIKSLEQPPPVSVRLNTAKPIHDFDNMEPVEWCADAYYLPERISFTYDPLFHAGCYYVQEASSMLIEKVFKTAFPADHSLKVIDLCAAPGGKSTHLLSLMNSRSLLVSNEIISSRNSVLRHNLAKWGYANSIVTQLDAERLHSLNGFFDLVLIDAPCSGEGLFRKDEKAIDEWSAEAAYKCSLRQNVLLKHAVELICPGGFLIYSTCTFNPDENDKQVEALLATGVLEVVNIPDCPPEITRTPFGLQCFPHRVRGEGFYVSLLRKKNGYPYRYMQKRSSIIWRKQDVVSQFTEYPGKLSTFIHDQECFAFPSGLQIELDEIIQCVPIKQAGFSLGIAKGKHFIPSAALALSNELKKDLPSCELSMEQAIQYLRCEDPGIRPDEKGWIITKYLGHPLGWIKSIPGRINNYFPREWRILK